jgi:hypothetical protein
MRRSALFCVTALAMLAFTSAPALAQTSNAYSQFKLKHNPNGAWSYLGAGAVLGSKLPDCAGLSNFNCWWNGGQLPSSAIIGAATKHAAVSYDTIVLPASTLALDPENIGSVAVQWTAPSAGQAVISGRFLGVDTNEASHSVAVLHNGTALKSYTIAHYQQKAKFHLSVTVAAGDTISFISYTPGSNYGYLTTGLQAKITLQ